MTNKNASRYSVPSNEDFEPHSNKSVIRNYLDIKSTKIIEAVEQNELERAELELLDIYDENHSFTQKIFAIFMNYGWVDFFISARNFYICCF